MDLPFGDGGKTDDEKVEQLFDPMDTAFSESDRRLRKIMLKMIFELLNEVRALKGNPEPLSKAQFKARLKAKMLEP